jgi:hypothetical protein
MYPITRWFMTLNSQEWLYVLIGTVAFGLFCMRGFGSRNNY